MTEKEKIYNELSRVLTDYENGIANTEDLYSILCKIQNEWETVIAATE